MLKKLFHRIQNCFPGSQYGDLITTGSNASDATYKLFDKLNARGQRIPSRAGNTVELSSHTVIIDGDMSPYTILPRRGNNVFHVIAETLWVAAGRDDVGTLVKWLPRAKEYSDNWNEENQTGTWRAAYGPRLRSWSAADGRLVDQLEVVIRRLKKSPESRQALMSIYDPGLDSVEGSKDYPCNNLVHFLIRPNKQGVSELKVFVQVRSNDAVFGFNINSFEWMFLAEYVAAQVGVRFGHYEHKANSLHVYENKMGTVLNVLQNYTPCPVLSRPKGYTADLRNVASSEFLDLCNEAYEKGGVGILPDIAPAMLKDYSTALYSESMLHAGDEDAFLGVISKITDPYLHLALLDIGQRRLKTSFMDRPEIERYYNQDHPQVSLFLRDLDNNS